MGRLMLNAMVFLVSLAGLPGCFSGEDDSGSGDGPSSSSRSQDTLTGNGQGLGACSNDTHDVPARVNTGEMFTVNVTLNCGFQWDSPHVAAHYASSRSASASLAAYPNACTVHQEDADGPRLLVNCTIADSGTYYLRGHAQVMNGGQLQDIWSQEFVIVAAAAPAPVVGAPSIQAFDVPSGAAAGQAFSFNVTVEWGSVLGARSSHMGAHSWTTSQADPMVAGAGSCSHVTEDRALPQRLATSCTGSAAGTLYVRGHARIENGGSLQDYWSDEVPVHIG